MTHIEGLFETHLSVADLERSIAFYRDIVGLPLAYRQESRNVTFHWIGAPGRAMLGLWQSHSILRLRLHVAFAVPLEDVLAAPARLRAAGVAPRDLNGAPDTVSVFGWMPAASVFFDDPDGHSLEYLSMLPDAARPELGTLSWADWNARTEAGEP